MTTLTSSNTDTEQLASGKYLTFFLGKEEYGLMILRVHEIIGTVPITPVPRLPQCMLGVINLRGKVIPVMDLRQKFGMPVAEITAETCIVIVEANGYEIGLMVDQVSEVLNVLDTDIEEPPEFGTGVNTEFLLGIAKSQNGVKLLLDIDKVLERGDTVAALHTGEQD